MSCFFSNKGFIRQVSDYGLSTHADKASKQNFFSVGVVRLVDMGLTNTLKAVECGVRESKQIFETKFWL